MTKNKYRIIGITGGIGSGKSFICNKLKEKGYVIYEADAAAKEIMKSNQVVQAIKKEFGENSYIQGELNKQYLSNLFKNPKELQKLNAIVHPVVAQHFENFLLQLQTPIPFIFKEAAILFESGTWKNCHQIVTIFAPLGIRIQRILKRDPHLTIDQIQSRMQQQWPDEWKIKHSHFVIFNDEIQDLNKQIQKMLCFIQKIPNQ
jgi:dephospho-CoA kinase